MKKIPKHYYAPILFCFIILIGIISVVNIFFSGENPPVAQQQPTPTPTMAQETPQMLLSFEPNIISVSPDGHFTAKIILNTFGNPAAGVSIVLTFDPNQISNVTLVQYKDPNSALSNALTTTFSSISKGSITQVYAVPENVPEQKGQGKITTLTGILLPNVKNTIIEMSASTAVSRMLKRVVLGKENLELQRN